MIDTHTHIDSEDFDLDLEETILRARAAGIDRCFLPAIDLASSLKISDICRTHPDSCHAMYGLHPEEVRDTWQTDLRAIKSLFGRDDITPAIAVGEVGLDYYWSREYEHQQLSAFEEQICWSIELQKPLMIHCRKAQNEMVRLMRHYEKDLPGGVFHCFTGNEHEAIELLEFDRFVLGIGGVLTFKKSKLPATLSSVVPLDRIVLETDAPYMAPVPHRGQRNEPAYVADICQKMAEAYGVTCQEVDNITTQTAMRVFFNS